MATSQDGPTLVGAQNENTNSIKPLLVNTAGELLVTSGGGGGGNVTIVGPLGQDTMANSVPVVIASDQSAIDVNVLSGGGSNASVGATGAAVPASATYVGVNVAGNLTGAAAGHGVAAGALRVELPTDGTGVIATVGAVTAITNALPAGNNNIGDVDVASVTGNVTVVQPTGTNLHVVVDSGSTTVSGTVTANQGTSPWIVAGGGTAGASGTAVLTVQGIAAGTAVPVSAASLPLPSGASTLAEQQTQTTSLQLIDDAVATTGSAITAKGLAAAGTDGTNARILKTDTSGELQVDVLTLPTVTVGSKTIYTRAVYGTAQTVFTLATDIAAGAFSGAGTDFTNNDATIGAVPYADAMIEMPDWAAAPVAGTVVQLWGLLINVDGTDDDTDAPASAASGGARLLGSWVIAAADALQRRTITISLAGIQNGFTPYVFNGTAQNMNNDGGTSMVVKITPWTYAQVG